MPSPPRPPTLTSDDLAELAHTLPRRTVLANEVLLTAGQFNDTLYFVTKGELQVTLPFERGALVVGSRGAGTWVGEVTVLEPGPASATVTAALETEVQALSASTLLAMTHTHPALAGRLVRALSEDLAYRVRTASVVLDDAPRAPPPGFFQRVFGGLFGANS